MQNIAYVILSECKRMIFPTIKLRKTKKEDAKGLMFNKLKKLLYGLIFGFIT